jgi:hypothetical protein
MYSKSIIVFNVFMLVVMPLFVDICVQTYFFIRKINEIDM